MKNREARADDSRHRSVNAELVNGSLVYTGCGDVEVDWDASTPPVEIDVDTGDRFPCIRDWYYDGDNCCDLYGQHFCVPADQS